MRSVIRQCNRRTSTCSRAVGLRQRNWTCISATFSFEICHRAFDAAHQIGAEVIPRDTKRHSKELWRAKQRSERVPDQSKNGLVPGGATWISTFKLSKSHWRQRKLARGLISRSLCRKLGFGSSQAGKQQFWRHRTAKIKALQGVAAEPGQ